MTQLEIRFFYPLTEQIPLDLIGGAVAQQPHQNLSGTFIANGGIYGTTIPLNKIDTAQTLVIRQSGTTVGYWEINDGVSYHIKNEPSWIVKKCSKILLGWKWSSN